MICPVCKATGFIKVRSIDAAKETHSDTKRPCPMGCAVPTECGVGHGRLAGREMTIDEAREAFPLPKGKPFTDYTGKSNTLDYRKHYGFKGD